MFFNMMNSVLFTEYTEMFFSKVVDMKTQRGVRLFANTSPELLFEAKKAAALQVPKGEKGSVQDLVNFCMTAIVADKELCDQLYWKGKKLFERHTIESN